MAFNYWCSNRGKCPSCEVCNNKGDVVIDEIGDYTCPNNSQVTLKELGVSSSTTIINGKMSQSEIYNDRSKRRKEHFQKEVMPYLPKEDQRNFARKGYKNK